MIPLTSDGYMVDNRGPRIGLIGVVVTLAVGGELKLLHFVTFEEAWIMRVWGDSLG